MMLFSESRDWVESVKTFIDKNIKPEIDLFEKNRSIPISTIKLLGEKNYWVKDTKSVGEDSEQYHVNFGLLCREIGRVSGSLLSLLTVNNMAVRILEKWGNKQFRQTWLNALINTDYIAAIAISEPNKGSDAANPDTTVEDAGEFWKVNGVKKWISAGQIADLFLISAKVDEQTTCFLVEKSRSGIEVSNINDVDGFRAAMLAEVNFRDVLIPKTNLIGSVGTGFSIILSYGLTFGRLSIAWGALGLAEACLAETIEYTKKRIQFGCTLDKHPLIQRKLTQMITDIRASSLACMYASELLDNRSSSSGLEVNIAKYIASKCAIKCANEAMHIQGAQGFSNKNLQRFKRDSAVLSIIEGSDEIQEMLIAESSQEAFL